MSYLAERIAEVELFAGLDEESRERLVAAGATMTFRPGATIVEQGKSDRSLFLLLDGTVDVEVNGAPAGSMEAGTHFGEIALLDASPRSATVRAGADGAKTFVISALAFDGVLDLGMAKTLLVGLSARIRRLQEEQGTTTA